MKSLTIISALLHFCNFALLQNVGASNSSRKIEVDGFLADLALSRYPHCALFFLRYEGNELGESLVGLVVQKLGGRMAYHNLVYFEKEKVVKNSTILFRKVKFHASLATFNRRSDVCKFVLVTVNEVNLEFFRIVKK